MRDVVDDQQPLGPVRQDLGLPAVDGLVHGRDQLPDVAEQKDPDYRHGDPGQPVFRLPVLDVGRGVNGSSRVRPSPEGGGAPDIAELGLDPAKGTCNKQDQDQDPFPVPEIGGATTNGQRNNKS